MDPPSCTVSVRVVRTTVAVATEPPPSDAAGPPPPPLEATAAPAATAAAARPMAATSRARLVERSPLTENSAIPARPGAGGPVAGYCTGSPAGPAGGALHAGRRIAACHLDDSGRARAVTGWHAGFLGTQVVGLHEDRAVQGHADVHEAGSFGAAGYRVGVL